MLFGQELQVKVTADFTNLPAYNKSVLANFADNIQSYLNNNRFTGQNWDSEKIQCTMNIFFISGNDQNVYTAQVFVSSQRPIYKSTRNSLMLRILDGSWNFNYEKNMSFNFSPSTFNSVLSFLDFYAYLILGMDSDSYQVLSGTPFYNKAFEIVTMGEASSFSKGWEKNSTGYNRRGLMDDILSETYRPFRETIFDYHYNGVDMYTQNKDAAQKSINKMVLALETIRKKFEGKSIFMSTFFEAKYAEIIEYMKDYNDADFFKKLKKIDPPHAAKYEEAMNPGSN